MRARFLLPVTLLAALAAGVAQQAGPYKVLRTARVGGEGGWDYIYADAAGWRLYIPRGASREIAATATAPAVPAAEARLTIFNLDTLDKVGEIAGVGGNGTAVDPKSGHGFTSDHPQVSMFDTKTMTLIKKIDVGAARPDGIYCDSFNQRV
jgi:DNA-binding beta-propeller fold protein YncE